VWSLRNQNGNSNMYIGVSITLRESSAYFIDGGTVTLEVKVVVSSIEVLNLTLQIMLP